MKDSPFLAWQRIFLAGFPVFLSVLYLVLYSIRSLDDNRLVSWNDAFGSADPYRVFFMIAAGIAVAGMVSMTSAFERYAGAWLFLSSFLLASFFWREPENIVDASRYFAQAKHLEVYGLRYFLTEWGRGINAWTDMPLVPFLYGVIFRIFGEARIFIQVFNTLLFSLTVLLTYRVGKTLWDEETGLYGGLLLMGIPYIFTQVPVMMVDVATCFFLMLAVHTFLGALDRGGEWVVYAALAVLLSVFSKYSSWLMLSVLGVIFFVRSKRDNYGRGLAVAALSGLMAAAAIALYWEVVSEQLSLLAVFQKPGLRRWGESFLSTSLFQINPVITFSAICSFYFAFRGRDRSYMIIAWLVLLVIVLDIRRIRYVIMVFPMMTLMASYGLVRLCSRDFLKFVVLSIVSFSFVIAASVYLPFLERISPVNLKDAGNFLNSLGVTEAEVFAKSGEGDAVNMAVAVPILDIYANAKIHYEYAGAAGPSLPEKEVSALRFTWEYSNPGYYIDRRQGTRRPVMVVISGELEGSDPPDGFQKTAGFTRSRVFALHDSVFAFQTYVIVYY